MSKDANVVDRSGGRARRLAGVAVCAAPLAFALALAVIAVPGLAGRAAAAPGGSSGLEPLRGHEAPVPPGVTPLGPAPSSVVLPLTVTLQPRDPAALAAEVRAVSDPTSPEYHHFLTPRQFAQHYGPSAATIAQVAATLRAEGLRVSGPSATGLSLPVSGTVTQVQSALGTQIDRYRLATGKVGYRNRTAPKVPAAVAPHIEGILGLDTLSPPRPTATLPVPNATAPRARAPAAAPALAPGQPHPTGTSCTSNIAGVTSYGALDAVDLAQAYSFDPLYSSGHYGAGATVALVELSGQAGYKSSDITTFANCYGITLGAGQVTTTNVGGGTSTGSGTVETELDIETVLSLAPGTNVEVYEGGASSSIYDVVNRIVSDDTAKIVSISWTNGCEAYVPASQQSSEDTVLQAAALEGQSVFVAAGDQGSEGCNVNAMIGAQTGSQPTAQVVDPSTGTLYVANQGGNSVSVVGEGSSGDPSSSSTAATVSTGSNSGPDAVALDTTDQKVFVANATSNTLTVLPRTTCNATNTSGCASPTPIPPDGHLSGPTALAVDGSTLYVANADGTVAVYDASSDTYVTTVDLSLSGPTSLAVDGTNGVVYAGVSGGSSGGVDSFDETTCNATVHTDCSSTSVTTSVGTNPAGLVVDDAAGYLYVANAGSAGGIGVVSLSSHALTTTIATGGSGISGTKPVRSLALSPDGTRVLAVLGGPGFPGAVLATVDPTTQSLVATVNLETGGGTMGALAVDGIRNYAWVTDTSANMDVVQNLNLAVSDPASQPYATAVGGTTVSSLGPAPTESTWNDQLSYAEGAGGGGISATFTMPAYQQALGIVSGSSGIPCGNSSGDCREIPDVSADGDPNTGYVIYDAVDGYGWTAVGGTSGAAPLWAAVVAVVASADSNTGGFGAMNPVLYSLAQNSPGTYFNDVTTGNNDYNATGGGQFAAASGYDMATGLGTPITSSLATGLAPYQIDIAVSGSQTYGGTPTFSATVDYAGSTSPPPGVTVNGGGLTCTDVGSATTISPSLSAGSHTLVASSCRGVTLSGSSAADYSVAYTSAAGDFIVNRATLAVAVAGTQTYGGSPSFTATPPRSLSPGVTVGTSGFTCARVVPSTLITPTLAVGTYTLVAGSCRGVTLSGSAAGNYTVVYKAAAGDFTVTPRPPEHGYWLVGSDGGIFTFGSANFYGSTGSLQLQRPVVGITPTSDEHGYWLVATDGGIFAFGDAGFYGSIPGLGLHPAGSGVPGSLNAPIAGMVPSADGGGYFMVASDGGVFAFGDAQFEGSCPGIGGCSGAAVAVAPDASGKGYWLVTQTGQVYTFGDAPYYGAPGPQSSPITAAVRSADGRGYYVLLANGTVYAYGDARSLGGPTGAVGGLDPASAIFTDAGGGGYWVASAAGAVFTYGDAPDDGSMAGLHLNGAIIDGTGF